MIRICRYVWCKYPSLQKQAYLLESSVITQTHQSGPVLIDACFRSKHHATNRRTASEAHSGCGWTSCNTVSQPRLPLKQHTTDTLPSHTHPCHVICKRQFSLDGKSLHASRRTDEDKERAVLSEYGRTYSAERKYTQRNLAEEEEEDAGQGSHEDDLKPEDMFGMMTTKYEKKFHPVGDEFDLKEDSDDEKGEVGMRPPGRRNTPIWYANQMKKLIKAGKVVDAIDMLDTRMLKEDRVQPAEINYNILIGACGREGYTKKAFKLYNQMKKRGLMPSEVTYTALFNACAESPWPLTDGLDRLRHLHSQLEDKDIKVNKITQHAMIKAYAKCGDLPTAFSLFRDLISSGAELTSESFAFLLFACASDKERGLIYAIEAWHQMQQRGIRPDIYTYNLLLRIARDCGIGDPDAAMRVLLSQQQQLQQVPAPKKNQKNRKGQRTLPAQDQKQQERSLEALVEIRPLEVTEITNPKLVSDLRSGKGNQDPVTSKALVQHQEQLPNLLDRSLDTNRIQALGNVSTPSDRLALIGGIEGVLGSMKDYGVTPDVKTLTLLMESLPLTTKGEEKLLEVVNECNVRVDVDFYNAIIRRRSRRADLEAAKAVLPLIQKQGLFPNLRTFVNLACECSRAKDGIQLLKDMKETGLKPTVHIYGALIMAAARRRDYRYQTELLKCMEKDQVSPNERILRRLEDVAAFGQNPKKDTLNKWQAQQQVKLNYFRGFYTQWLDRMGIEEEPHPWRKFNTPGRGSDQNQTEG